MPRMSKKRQKELAFFLNDSNRMTYHALCRKCVHGCKQSFQICILGCLHYRSKRSVAALPRGPDAASATFPERGEE